MANSAIHRRIAIALAEEQLLEEQPELKGNVSRVAVAICDRPLHYGITFKVEPETVRRGLKLARQVLARAQEWQLEKFDREWRQRNIPPESKYRALEVAPTPAVGQCIAGLIGSLKVGASWSPLDGLLAQRRDSLAITRASILSRQTPPVV